MHWIKTVKTFQLFKLKGSYYSKKKKYVWKNILIVSQLNGVWRGEMNLQNSEAWYCEITDVSEECAAIVFVVFFCREIGGSRLLRYVREFLPEYTVLRLNFTKFGAHGMPGHSWQCGRLFSCQDKLRSLCCVRLFHLLLFYLFYTTLTSHFHVCTDGM